MAVNGKQKGNTYEREVAKTLSDLYGASFVRAAHSGAFIGGSNAYRKSVLSENQIKSFKGDIIPPDEWRHFNCECKSYSDFGFHQLFTPEGSKVLDGWIDQMMLVAEPGDCNVLFMKFNRKGQYIAVPDNGDWHLQNYVRYGSHYGSFIITELTSFLTLNSNLLKAYCTKV
jgi:hypothetical protein